MSEKAFANELQRALARPDAEELKRHVQAYHDQFRGRLENWTEQDDEAVEKIMDASLDDPEKTFAYVMIAASASDDDEFLGFVSCGPLENLLVKPSREILDRVVAEARKTPRLRWMLSIPFRHALAPEALEAIKPLFVDADREPLPPRPWA
jgi:hypothetical protein